MVDKKLIKTLLLSFFYFLYDLAKVFSKVSVRFFAIILSVVIFGYICEMKSIDFPNISNIFYFLFLFWAHIPLFEHFLLLFKRLKWDS